MSATVISRAGDGNGRTRCGRNRRIRNGIKTGIVKVPEMWREVREGRRPRGIEGEGQMEAGVEYKCKWFGESKQARKRPHRPKRPRRPSRVRPGPEEWQSSPELVNRGPGRMWPGGSRIREQSEPDPRRPETAGSEGNSAQEKRAKNIKTKSETKSEQDVQHMARISEENPEDSTSRKSEYEWWNRRGSGAGRKVDMMGMSTAEGGPEAQLCCNWECNATGSRAHPAGQWTRRRSGAGREVDMMGMSTAEGGPEAAVQRENIARKARGHDSIPPLRLLAPKEHEQQREWRKGMVKAEGQEILEGRKIADPNGPGGAYEEARMRPKKEDQKGPDKGPTGP
ncbi:hypothetical protein B0H12DRAFT_1299823 [Mycena haematopus]|nr:hypothetical protein B0H12DRAFT_1299823 [Mycena haematopus]